MQEETRDALIARLTRYDRLVEVGIGRRTEVAAALAERALRITATDVKGRSVPDGVAFERDDVTDPNPAVYTDTDVVYALNCPPELHRPAREVARGAGAAFLFTTLGCEGPAIPVERETLPGGETLFRALPVRAGPRAEDFGGEPDRGERQ